jgi:hypothetical protein
MQKHEKNHYLSFFIMSIFSRWLFIFPIKDAFTNGKILTAGMEYFLDLNKIMIFPSSIIQVEHVLDFKCLCLIEFILECLEDLLTGEVLFFVEVVEHYEHVLDDVLSEEEVLDVAVNFDEVGERYL